MEWILPTFIFLTFCLLHSLLAEPGLKEKVIFIYPSIRPYYRVIYSILSIVILGFWWVNIPVSTGVIYEVNSTLHLISLVIQLIAIAGFLYALFSFNVRSFIGVQQIVDFISMNKLPEYLDEPAKGKLVTSGIHRYMRHPLYSFAILYLLANSSPTYSQGYFMLCIIVYFYVGSFFEERKLIERFGMDYVEYQKRTGRFFPKLFIK